MSPTDVFVTSGEPPGEKLLTRAITKPAEPPVDIEHEEAETADTQLFSSPGR